VTRVTTESESVLDERLRARTARHPELAGTDVKSIAELAYDPEQMRMWTGRQQLLRALSRRPRDRATGAAGVSEPRASELVDQLYARENELRIRSDPMWRIAPSEQSMLQALAAPVPLSALARAGLRIDLVSATSLRFAAESLLWRASAGAVAADAAPHDGGARHARHDLCLVGVCPARHDELACRREREPAAYNRRSYRRFHTRLAASRPG